MPRHDNSKWAISRPVSVDANFETEFQKVYRVNLMVYRTYNRKIIEKNTKNFLELSKEKA